jgi:hypothetical protein
MARPCLPTPASRACLTIRHELPGNNQFIFRRRRIISASAENRGNSCQRKHSAPGTRLGQSCVSQTSQLKTRIVSVARIRLNPWKTVRPFKGIICDDISEFESYMPSQPVRSLWVMSGLQKYARHSRELADRSNSRSPRDCYPMLTCNVFIARKTRATMSTLQAVAQIPAFMAGSILTLRRRKDVALVALAFEGIGFVFWISRARSLSERASMKLGGDPT